MTRRKSVAIILALAVAVTTLTACGSGKENKGEYTLLIGNTSDSVLKNPINQIAEEADYFGKENLTVEYETLTETGSFEALSAGKVDSLFVEVITPISYGVQGADITIFGGTLSGGMIAVCRTEDAEELSDVEKWRGKTIGAIQYSRTEVLARHVLKDNYGYEIDKDIFIKNVEDYASVQLGVVKGNVDIGLVPSYYADGATDSGLTVLFPLTHLEEDYVCCRQSAYTKKLEENRDAYVALLKAQIKAYKDYTLNEDKAVELLAKNSGESEDYIRTYVYNKETNGNRKYNPDPNYNGILNVYNTMAEVEYILADRPLADFTDISVYADALKAVIEENSGDAFYESMWDYFVEHNNEYPDFEKTYGNYL